MHHSHKRPFLTGGIFEGVVGETLERSKTHTTPSFALVMSIGDLMGVVCGFRGLMTIVVKKDLHAIILKFTASKRRTNRKAGAKVATFRRSYTTTS